MSEVHFTYQDPPCKDELMQGDVLERTPALDALLKDVHPHFHQHPKNMYFMVLTQTCDLVRRHKGGACKTPYITIAPVRPVDLVIERQISAADPLSIRSELPVLTDKAKSRLSDFLRRFYNNNELGYFFLEPKGTPLLGECCAFLNLSISIRAHEHFEKCLDAKVLQLSSEFQAKLGWLVGQMYARVGTTDWDAKEMSKKVESALGSAAIWVQDGAREALEEEYRTLSATSPELELELASHQIKKIINKAPDRKSKVIDRTLAIVEELTNLPPELSSKIKARLVSDEALTILLKKGG